MIEVFKTNVKSTAEASELVAMLHRHFPASRINFDLGDCDRILRVEGPDFHPERVAGLLNESGYHCSVLDH